MDDQTEIAEVTVLPVQFVDRTFRTAELQPERQLQLAVLADAATTYARSGAATTERERRILAELEEWFAEDLATGPFSFVGICDSLGFDPAYIRRGIRMTRPPRADRTVRYRLRRITVSHTRVVRLREWRVA